MDQLQQVLTFLRRHGFWVLSGITFLVMLVVWFMASGELQAQYEKEKGARDSVLSQVEGVNPISPNDKFIQRLQERTNSLKKTVFAAWQYRFAQQRKLYSRIIGGLEFADLLLKSSASTPVPQEILVKYQNDFDEQMIQPLYRRLKLRKLVYLDEEGNEIEPPQRARSSFSPTGGGEFGPSSTSFGPSAGAGPPGVPAGISGVGAPSGTGNDQNSQSQPQYTTEWRGVVYWAPEDRMSVLEARFAWPQLPTRLQVKYAVEEYVVLSNLCDVIAQTNGDVAEHMQATIKGIVRMRVGQLAAPVTTRPRPRDSSEGSSDALASGSAMGAPGAPGASMGAPGASGGAMPGAPAGMPGGGDGVGLGLGGSEQAGRGVQPSDPLALFAKRYVNDDGFPIQDPRESPYAEFMMMPIQLVLIMDHRKVQELLANAARSPFPVEVRLVNMKSLRTDGQRQGGLFSGGGLVGETNLLGGGDTGGGLPGGALPGAPGAVGGGPPGAPGGGPLGAPGGALPGAPGGSGTSFPGSSGSSPLSGVGRPIEIGPYDWQVEIRGVVFIFRPPDEEKLGTSGDVEEVLTAVEQQKQQQQQQQQPAGTPAPTQQPGQQPPPAQPGNPAAVPGTPPGGTEAASPAPPGAPPTASPAPQGVPASAP